MLTKIFSYCLVAALFILPLVLYRKVYFRPVTVLRLTKDGSYASAVLPGYSFKRAFGCGRKVVSVNLGSGYKAFYALLDEDVLSFNSLKIPPKLLSLVQTV